MEAQMTTITIALPEDSVIRLQEKASRLGMSVEDLVLASVDDLLSQPDEAFKRAVDYVLQKNADLYQRLA
jgi:antitoxin FitA